MDNVEQITILIILLVVTIITIVGIAYCLGCFDYLGIRIKHSYNCHQKEKQGMDVCDCPIISFEDLKKFYWLNPESWTVIETDCYDGKGNDFKYFYCQKYLRDNQLVKYGFNRKDYKAVKRFIRKNAVSGQARLDARTRADNVDKLRDLLKDVQADIDDIRAKQAKEIKKAKKTMENINLK